MNMNDSHTHNYRKYQKLPRIAQSSDDFGRAFVIKFDKVKVSTSSHGSSEGKLSKKREIFERNCLFEIKRKKIKFLCLAGFMKVLSNSFIKTFGYKIINIHPSLLPKYKGLNTHRRVLKNNEKYSGCTVHFVTPKLDSGKIISQKKIWIDENETEKSLKKKILKQEHKLYPQSIISVFKQSYLKKKIYFYFPVC